MIIPPYIPQVGQFVSVPLDLFWNDNIDYSVILKIVDRKLIDEETNQQARVVGPAILVYAFESVIFDSSSPVIESLSFKAEVLLSKAGKLYVKSDDAYRNIHVYSSIMDGDDNAYDEYGF